MPNWQLASYQQPHVIWVQITVYMSCTAFDEPKNQIINERDCNNLYIIIYSTVKYTVFNIIHCVRNCTLLTWYMCHVVNTFVILLTIPNLIVK